MLLDNEICIPISDALVEIVGGMQCMFILKFGNGLNNVLFICLINL